MVLDEDDEDYYPDDELMIGKYQVETSNVRMNARKTHNNYFQDTMSSNSNSNVTKPAAGTPGLFLHPQHQANSRSFNLQQTPPTALQRNSVAEFKPLEALEAYQHLQSQAPPQHAPSSRVPPRRPSTRSLGAAETRSPSVEIKEEKKVKDQAAKRKKSQIG